MNPREALLGSKLRIAGTAVLALVVLVAVAFAAGVFGVPSVEEVDNEFGDVNQSTTEIETDVVVSNPNPVGTDPLGVSIGYSVRMNEVTVADGQKSGLGVGSGTSTVDLTTMLDNEKIPEWWESHIRNGERTELTIDATVSSSTLLGQSITVSPSPETIETDVLSAVNTEEERPIDVPPTPANPDLVITETRAEWGTVENGSTPIEMQFDVLNPRGDGPTGQVPYVVTKLDYVVTMNGITVGEGSTQTEQVIRVGETETLETAAAIRTEKLDEWWVSHLRNDQQTTLVIEFRPTVQLEDPVSGETVTRTLPTPITYESTIETNIFGNQGA